MCFVAWNKMIISEKKKKKKKKSGIFMLKTILYFINKTYVKDES